jgi:hypothetical protein
VRELSAGSSGAGAVVVVVVVVDSAGCLLPQEKSIKPARSSAAICNVFFIKTSEYVIDKNILTHCIIKVKIIREFY